MPYINPANLYAEYFRPVLSSGIGLIPNFMAREQEKKRLAQQQAQFETELPHREAQAGQARALAEKYRVDVEARRKAQQALADLSSGGLPGLTKILEGTGMTPEQYFKMTQAGIKFSPLDIQQKPEQAVSWQRGTRTFFDAQGNKWEQDYNFNPKTTERINVGTPRKASLTQEEQLQQKVKEKKVLEGVVTSPTQQLQELKLAAWQSYLMGNQITQQQAKLIGIDKDPYISIAAQQVASDLKMWRLPLKDKINKIIETADLIRQAMEGKMRIPSPTQPLPGKSAPAIELPAEITKTSEAIEWLQTLGMSRDEAIAWLRAQNEGGGGVVTGPTLAPAPSASLPMEQPSQTPNVEPFWPIGSALPVPAPSTETQRPEGPLGVDEVLTLPPKQYEQYIQQYPGMVPLVREYLSRKLKPLK